MKKLLACLFALMLLMTASAMAAELELTVNAMSGFYDDPFTLEMTVNSKKATIY